MLGLAVEALALLLSLCQLAGSATILGLANSTPQIPAPRDASYLYPTTAKDALSNNTLALMFSSTIHQADNPLCNRSHWRPMVEWALADALMYTFIVVLAVRREFRRMRRQRVTRKWFRDHAGELEMRQVADGGVSATAAAAAPTGRAAGPDEERDEPRPIADEVTTADTVPVNDASQALVTQPAAAFQQAVAAPAYTEEAQPTVPAAPTAADPLATQAAPADLAHRPLVPPNLRPGRTKRPPTLLDLLFWLQHIGLLIAMAVTLWSPQMKVCADVAPVVRYGVASLLILLWVQYALSMLVISWVQKLVARRATVMSSSITTPHYGTDSTGRPVRPKYVKVVSFVPSLAEWRGTPLPYPPREIQPEAEDGAQGNGLAGGDEPECSICYGEFLPPYRAIMAGKPGTWCADPLWELQCGHIFHEHCCAEWFAVRGAQPMCPYCTQPANNIQPQPTSRPPADPVGL